MRNSYLTKELVISLLAFFALIGSVYSQKTSFGNTYISSGSEMAVSNLEYNFANGAQGILGGIVGTGRSASGFLSFVGSSTYTGSGSTAYVDGYVRTYMQGQFVFPIGDNGIYRPAGVSKASLANPVDAAYYGVSATTAITSSLKGGNEPPLPTAGGFNTATFDTTTVLLVGDKEYWDINGNTPTKITLTWGVESEIATLVDSKLSNLTIVGWDGTKWVEVLSSFDGQSILGTVSSFLLGSITTNNEIIPNSYSVYTLAKRSCTSPIKVESSTCEGATYSVVFTAPGIVQSDFGTVTGNTVTGVPAGQKVTLKVTSECGLDKTLTVQPPADCDFDIKVFNGLTPEDPDGKNTFLYIGGIEKYPDNSVQVYNRWGVLVYDRKGYNNIDGVFKGASEGRVTLSGNKGLTEGTYFYIINYKDPSNSITKEKAGYLYISR